MKILLVSPGALTLVQFRSDFIRALRHSGHEVCVIIPNESTALNEAIFSLGVTLRHLATSRTSINPLNEWRAIRQLHADIREFNPDIVLGYTHKGILYSGLALPRKGGSRFYGMLSGLGVVFTGTGWKKTLAQAIFRGAYRIAARRMQGIFFLNPDDEKQMKDGGFIPSSVVTWIIPGEGINISKYPATPVPVGPISFLMIARLLRDKGVFEYLLAAELVKNKCPEATFHLVGALDDNPASLTKAELARFVGEGHVVYHGAQRDVVPFLQSCSVYVLPSYREGLPRSTMEAMSVGRAVITTDVPGCRETVEPGINGYIVPARDAEALASAMLRFVEMPTQAIAMGAESQRIARERFEINRINALLFSHMNLGPVAQ